jgi:hypothetical protein
MKDSNVPSTSLDAPYSSRVPTPSGVIHTINNPYYNSPY